MEKLTNSVPFLEAMLLAILTRWNETPLAIQCSPVVGESDEYTAVLAILNQLYHS
jgi:hypothetical protein